MEPGQTSYVPPAGVLTSLVLSCVSQPMCQHGDRTTGRPCVSGNVLPLSWVPGHHWQVSPVPGSLSFPRVS